MQWLPLSLRTRLDQKPALHLILKNTAWLSADKLVGVLTGLIVGAWVARYLGPEQLGTLSYALAFVAIMVPFAELGLRDIVIRTIVQDETDKDEILGTNLVLQFVAGLATFIATIVLARAINAEDYLTILLIGIISLQLIFQSFGNTAEYWFRSQVQAKYLVWSRNIVLVFIAILKVGLILSGASLVAFAWITLLSTILLCGALVIAYNRSGEHFLDVSFSLERAKSLLKDSWPLLFSSFAIVIYMKMDQLMLGQMATKADLGYYSAAVRLSEFWYFIPVALASSVFPSIIRSRQFKDAVVYQKRMQVFYDAMVGVSYLIAVPLALLATPIVLVLFGREYIQSGPILTIHAWAFIFVSIGVARSHWLVAENMVRFSLLATVLGAVVNLAMNYVLIPEYAGIGAAWATVIAYCVSAYLSSLITARTRVAFVQSSLALLFPVRLVFRKTNLREIL
jgi:O-antigen/teichoic acid export membrane protein